MKDKQIFDFIRKHYNEILEELKLVNDDFEGFQKLKIEFIKLKEILNIL
mgnify:CR=1 FL=1